MEKRHMIIIAGALGATTAIGVFGAAAQASGDNEQPITGTQLSDATRAALDHTGGGRVTGTEVGDEESYYEVEVTLDDGRQVDVQLDETFKVVGASDDVEGETDGSG